MAANNNILLDGGDDDDIFVYTGGRAPRDVRRAKIDESIDTIPQGAFFRNCGQLIEVEGHNKLKKIEGSAFNNCPSLRRVMKMSGVIEIGKFTFMSCHGLSDIDFDRLEIIGKFAFAWCKSLRSTNLPSIRRVGQYAFQGCEQLSDAVFGEDLEGIEGGAFHNCPALRRIAIPLKDGLIIEDDAFYNCDGLSRVDTVTGGVHETTISSLHMESWRNEMRAEIDQINQTLPEIQASEKTATIQQWIRSVIDRMEHYKTEHKIVLKEAMTLLELALWKAKLEDNGSNIDAESVEVVRKEHRVTCGASIVIKNVLPYLVLK